MLYRSKQFKIWRPVGVLLLLDHKAISSSHAIALERHALLKTTVAKGHTECLIRNNESIGGDKLAPNVAGYDESSQCAGAFRILRQMVSAFMKDVAVYQNIFADQQLSHLFRWLKDPNSLLYEPSLKRILDNLISKMFNQLVNEFQRLGSRVVFSSCSRIIVCTKRKSVDDASAYVEFVVNSMRSKELFHSIDFNVKQAFKVLLWMDPVSKRTELGKCFFGEKQIV